MSDYKTMGSGSVWTPDSVTVVHFGSPPGLAFTEPDKDGEVEDDWKDGRNA